MTINHFKKQEKLLLIVKKSRKITNNHQKIKREYY